MMRHLALLFLFSIYIDVTSSAWLPSMTIKTQNELEESRLAPEVSWMPGEQMDNEKGSSEAKRGKDYGWGMMFGKRTDDQKGVASLDTKRGNDYGWGMMFGKRNDNRVQVQGLGTQSKKDPGKDDYGWGMLFGKRALADDPSFSWDNVDDQHSPAVIGDNSPTFLPKEDGNTNGEITWQNDNMKRSNAYGFGMRFGKRGNSETKKGRSADYGWGMMFGKRSPQDKFRLDHSNIERPSEKKGFEGYGFGPMFGKRQTSEDPFVAEIPDRDFDDYETDLDEQEQSNGIQDQTPMDVLRESIKHTILDKRSKGRALSIMSRNGDDIKRGHNDYGWGLMFG